MRLSPKIALTALLLLVPAVTFAMQETVWDFRGGHLPGKWRISNIEVPQTMLEGLHIQAPASDGSLLSEMNVSHSVQAVSFTFLTGRTMEARLLWHRPGTEPGIFVQFPFTIPGSKTEQTVTLNLEALPQWDGTADEIGFVFPRGSDLLMREIRFQEWNMLERAQAVWESFWTFDRLGATSINFIWGPVIVFNPVGLPGLFSKMPPEGRSGMWILYALIAAAGAVALTRRYWITYLRNLRVPGALLLFLLSFGSVWVFFDLRMGLELLNDAKHDYDSYLYPPSGNRQFRTFLNFNDSVERSLPVIKGETTIGLLTTPETPVRDMLRYFAFPTLVQEPSAPNPDLRVWFVFYRNDTAVDAGGRLTVKGVPWTGPGRIVERFDNASFLFQASR